MVCPRCSLRYDRRPDGRCPRCHTPEGAAPRATVSAPPARRVPAPARARGDGGRGVATGLAALVLLVAVALLAQRYGRPPVESRRLGQRARAAFPARLEPLPDVDGDRFFAEQHRRCFAEAYTPSWLWNRLDRPLYLRCLDRAYAERLVKVAVLEQPSWGPHSDPRWGRLDFIVRLREGRLPRKPGETSVTDCPGQGPSWGESPSDITFFEPVGESAYTTHTLAGLRERPCTLKVYLTWERWALAEPLVVSTPPTDPARLQAREENVRRKDEADARSLACVSGAVGLWPKRPEVPPDLPIGRAVSALRAPDVRTREDALRELTRMGPEARPALPAVVAVLSPGYDQTKGYVIGALAAADPRGEEVRPVLACLLDQPSSIVRQAAAVALAKVGDAAGARALGADLDSSETRTRVSAARELEHLRERGQPGRDALLRHLASDASAEVRKACAAALPWIDPDSEAVVHALEAALQDPDEGVRAQLQISIPDLERAKGYRRLKAMPPGPP
jgi:hypothetical protein